VSGALGYESPNHATPAGAIFILFLHKGQGTDAYSVRPGNITTEAPGTFNWVGSDNAYWFACPRPGPGYQVLKQMTAADQTLDSCTVVSLSALDWSGGPAAGVYL
jgi:hypothetical protein